MALVTFADKATGGTLAADDVNQLKRGVTKLDADNRPDLIATGAGTTASPYTHADNTGGIKTAVTNLTRGTQVRLVAGEYTVSTAIPLNQHGLAVSGDSAGFNQDPNGESEGFHGTKLKANGSDVFVVSNSGRRGGVVLEKMYVWGSGYAQGKAAISIQSGLDQPRFRDMNVSNVYAAIAITGSGALDTVYVTNFNALNAGYGILSNSTAGCYFNHYQSGCFADLEYSGVALLTANHLSCSLVDITFVRCARKNDTTSGGNSIASAIRLLGQGHRVIGCTISETGRDSLASASSGSQVYNANAHGIVVDWSDALISGNTIIGNATGNGVWVRSANATITGNTYSGRAVGGDFGPSPFSATKGFTTNLVDIYVDATATDTTINEPQGTYIVDNGIRTVINGRSTNAGDPDTAGTWKDVPNGNPRKEGITIYDNISGNLWLYSKNFQNGRVLVGNYPAAQSSQPAAGQVQYFRAKDVTTATESTRIRATKSTGANNDPSSGAVGTKMIGAGTDNSQPTAILTLQMSRNQEGTGHYFGVVRPANIGTNNVRVYEGDYFVYARLGDYQLYQGSAGGPVFNDNGGGADISLRFWSDRVELLKGATIVTTINQAPTYPLAPEIALENVGNSILGLSLTGQNLLDTPAS